MSIKDKIQEFKSNNPDFILESNGEFLIAVDVDCSNIPQYQRNVVNSYDQTILSSLPERLQKYLNEKYENINSYKSFNKQYEITNIQGTEKYKRIFYYLQFDTNDLIPKKVNNNFLFVKDILNNKISTLDFSPTQKDKNNIIVKTISNVDARFRDWYLCSFEEVSNEKPINTAINLILKSILKKGSWIKKDSSKEFLSSSKNSLDSVKINNISLKTEIANTVDQDGLSLFVQIFVATDNNPLLTQLENDIFSFYNNSVLSQTKPEILFNENSFISGIAIFNKFYKDSVSNLNSYLIGIPKYIIDKFPDLSLSIDYKELELTDYVSFSSLQELKIKIEALKNIINKKKESLSNIALSVENYDTDYLLSNIDQFIDNLSTNIKEKKYDENKEIILYFSKRNCQQKPLELEQPNINAINDSEYKKCVEEFVDEQTNYYLSSALVEKIYEIKNLTSNSIDGNLSAHLLLNCKEIINASDSYTAKNFFSKLIYSKTKFEKEERLDLSTFYTAAQVSFQKSFVTDAVNIVKFSKIKENIEKQNYKNKSISQNIKDALADINSIKRLYETILYRYDLKDVADELLKCFLAKNPGLNAGLIAAQQFIDSLIKLLNFQDPNLAKLANCLGVKVPLSLGQISFKDLPPADAQQIKDSFKNVLSSAIKNVTDIDYVIPTIIKCYSEFGDEQAKQLIDNYVKSEEARKALKQQYDQLVREAKLYKSGPGVKDSLNKQTSEKKTFLKKARRNAWILLQRQAEQEAERLVTEAAIKVIKTLLKELNDCKPENSKNTKDNLAGIPGELRIQANPNLVNQKVNNLLQELSLTLSPDKLCSLFYGSADDETFEFVLSSIKQKVSDLYTSAQTIKIGDKVFFSEPLSSVQAVRKFFISLSTANPELTSKKCDKYFEDLSNSPFALNDQDKCVDFSQDYINKKRKELIDKGFTEEQANQIIENEKKLQAEKYKNIQETLNVGIYNQITSGSENNQYPVSDMVKEKTEKQLDKLTTSLSQFIDAYKGQLFELTGSSTLSSAQLPNFGETFATYEAIFGQNGDIFKIGNNTIFYKKTEMLNPYKEISPIYQYTSNEPYSISLKSKDYDSLKASEPITPTSSLKKKLKLIWSNFNVGFSNFDDYEDNFWFEVCLSNSAVFYSKKILELYKQNYDIIKKEKFDKNKITTDVKELIYFEEK